MRPASIFLLLLAQSSGCAAFDATTQAGLEEREKGLQRAEDAAKTSSASTSATTIKPSFGTILLLRRGQTLCAIRFTSFQRKGKATAPSIFSTGEESRYAEYDWYIQDDGSYDLKKDNAKLGHAKLKRSAPVGIGRAAIQLGNDVIDCGAFKVKWLYPITVVFNYHHRGFATKEELYKDWGEFEAAPTRWKEISDVTATHPDLQWYRFEEGRSNQEIELGRLPQ